jgi:hypothetical protein
VSTRSPEPGVAGGNRYRREPLRDISEQLLLLQWRSRELSEAKALAAGSGARHFLFHRNGHAPSLWKVINGSPSVYFSHPISQVRRDLLLKRDPGKCNVPDQSRGRKLRSDCDKAAAAAKRAVPLVEPTAIDELRIDFKELCDSTEERLRDAILPPVTERWPLGDGPHLGGRPDVDNGPWLRVESGALERLEASNGELARYESAVEVLADEIRRQINTRDHTLAEQCDAVLVFRPFSLPDSPAPTGGVEKEMEMVQRRILLEQIRLEPALIVVHPFRDERKRRQLEFDIEWPKLVTKWLADNRSGVDDFASATKKILVEAPYTPDLDTGEERHGIDRRT